MNQRNGEGRTLASAVNIVRIVGGNIMFMICFLRNTKRYVNVAERRLRLIAQNKNIVGNPVLEKNEWKHISMYRDARIVGKNLWQTNLAEGIVLTNVSAT